jgi:hypothetical protein
MLITPIPAPRCFAIDSDLRQGLRAGGEQQVVEQTRVLQGLHVEFEGTCGRANEAVTFARDKNFELESVVR